MGVKVPKPCRKYLDPACTGAPALGRPIVQAGAGLKINNAGNTLESFLFKSADRYSTSGSSWGVQHHPTILLCPI